MTAGSNWYHFEELFELSPTVLFAALYLLWFISFKARNFGREAAWGDTVGTQGDTRGSRHDLRIIYACPPDFPQDTRALVVFPH